MRLGAVDTLATRTVK